MRYTILVLASPLQSPAWAHCQTALGKRVQQLSGPGWRASCIVESRRLGRYLYVPYGPVCDDADALPAALEAVTAFARECSAWWVRVEPRPHAVASGEQPLAEPWGERLAHLGFSRAGHDHQPAHSRLIDLTQDEDAILADMTGSIRTIHRNHAKKGLEVRASRRPEDVAVLTRFLDDAARVKSIRARSHDYLTKVATSLMPEGAATLYSTWKDDEPLCATLVYDSPEQRLFAHAAMPVQHRKLRPNQPLITAALLDARRAGQLTADLFGLAPPDEPAHPWAGFSAFKRSFGGQDVAYPGTWERDLLPGARRALALRDTLVEKASEVARTAANAPLTRSAQERLRRHSS